MNIVYHTITGITSAVVISNKVEKLDKENKAKTMLIAIVISMLSHGVLDLIPHSYSLNILIDIFLMLILMGLSLIVFKRNFHVLILTCIVSSILPDIIDKLLIKVFFHSQNYFFLWHKAEVINVFYNIYFKIIPIVYYWITDIILVVLCVLILNKYKKSSLKFLNRTKV